MRAVALQQAEILDGRDADQLIKVAEDEAFKVICGDENKLAERMARYRRDRRILLNLADGESMEGKTEESACLSINTVYHEALSEYHNAVTSKNLNTLVARYPLKHSRVFEVIATALERPDQRCLSKHGNCASQKGR